MNRHELHAPHLPRLCLLLAVLAVVLAPASVASAAEAPAFGAASFSASSTSTQAGAHPDFTSSFELATDALGNPIQQIKDAQVELPAGLLGNPLATPRCTATEFQTFKCPPDSQIGVLEPQFLIQCPGVQTTLGAGGVGQIPPTALTEALEVNQSTLTVESSANMESGDNITIGEGSEAETFTISTIPDATHIRIDYGVMRAHPAGTRVVDPTILVASTQGFCASEDRQITIGSGATAETANIQGIEGPHRLLLQEPLAHSHSIGEPVTHIAATHSGPLPIFNLEPSAGHAATLGVSVLITSIFVQLDVRNDSSNALTASFEDLSTMLGFEGARFTLWGVPDDPSHDSLRCGELGIECEKATGIPTAFVTNSTDCSAPLTAKITLDSWQNPGHYVSTDASMPTPTGCERLRIAPTLTVSTDDTQADTPAGYTVDLGLPQSEDAYGLATPTLRSTAITLPAGSSLSPSGTSGLVGCTDEQFAAGSCPGASTIGSASIASPLLSDRLQGHVYIAAPTPTETYRIFILGSADNVTLRLTGHVHLDPATGQPTIVFDDNPQFPLSDLRASFFGGPTATLTNPPTCGLATTTAQVVAYSGQTATSQSSFTVTGDSQGAPCPATQPFSPGFIAGTTSPLADGFSPLTMSVSREDGQQPLSTIATQLPPGLLAMVTSVPACGEPQAAQGDCPAASRIGTTTASGGAGAQPLSLSGPVYLTGPYEGAPYGAEVTVPLIAGPYNLGTLIVRSRAFVDPDDLHLTIISDPIPLVVDGIPLRLRKVNLTIDRPGFIFNPSYCSSTRIIATLGSSDGVEATAASPFQIGGCRGLPFAPKLTASTKAKASSRGNGAALDLKVVFPKGPRTDIHRVEVTLPQHMLARLTTIQQSCPVARFLANPATCPPASLVGTSTVDTLVLGSKLTGPVYLVSHGRAALPDLRVLLQAQGISLDLVGTLKLSSSGIITTTFAAVPDDPINSFELDLPQGPHSALAADANLCAKGLAVPYKLTAQNGAQVQHSARLAVQGCPRKSRRASNAKGAKGAKRAKGARRGKGGKAARGRRRAG